MNTQHIHWLGHSSFRIQDGATQVYVDPWKLPPGAPKADVVFITHAHYDHFSKEDLSKIHKEGTACVAPKDVAYQINGTVIAVTPGEITNIGQLKVRTVAAYNLTRKFHPKQSNWIGYLITLSTGQKIYHSGDSDFTPEMRGVVTDLALLPIGGTYTMDARRRLRRRMRSSLTRSFRCTGGTLSEYWRMRRNSNACSRVTPSSSLRSDRG
jgi:L-ascorbate metabolism protein UlaG (beta-lactamase superfamily)